MQKVVIFSGSDYSRSDSLENDINKFLQESKVKLVSVSYTETWSDEYREFSFGAMLVYEEVSQKGEVANEQGEG